MSSSIKIVDYDPIWPILYDEEKHCILDTVGHKVVAIEHIGSTAVSGLGGKPIIDIIAGVNNSLDAYECIPLLKDRLDYKRVKETPQPDEPNWYCSLSKGYQFKTDYHLHFIKIKSDFWEKHILFRDFLRAHPDIAQQYYELKKKLSEKYGSNRMGYTEAKTSFINSVIAQTRKK